MQAILNKIELRALCFVLAVAVASLAVVVIKKNDKITAFRLDLSVANERIAELEANQANIDANIAAIDARDVLDNLANKTGEFEAEIGKLTNDLKTLVQETTALATEEGGVFDNLLKNVQGLIQKFQGEVPAIQKNIETLANTIENKVSGTLERIEPPATPELQAPAGNLIPNNQPINNEGLGESNELESKKQ